MKLFLPLLLLALLAIDATAKPAPKTAPKTEAKEIAFPPMLQQGPTNWGELTQRGESFYLEGHPQWEAVCTLKRRKDGAVYAFVLLTQRSTGQPCPGIYQIAEDGSLVGRWGYGDACSVDDDGNLTGTTQAEVIRPVAPEPPPVL